MATIRTVSGFAFLVTGVTEFFAGLDHGTVVSCGYRERARHLNQGTGGANRVVFLPGDPNGAAGKLLPPRDVGRLQVNDSFDERAGDIRPLVSWERQFSISVWGWDPEAMRDEIAQASATETLLEKVVQAVEQVARAGGPNIEWGPVAWTVPQQENSFGTELVVGLTLAHPLMDVPEEIAFPGFTLQRVGT